MAFSSVRLSRRLEEDELLEFECIMYVTTNEADYNGQEMVCNDSTFTNFNMWVVNGLRLDIEDGDDYIFFIEMLLYLIKRFFEPKNIYLNGHIFATDDLFGSFQCYYVSNNHILVNQQAINYFDQLILCNGISNNHSMIKNHMREIIDKN